MGDKWKIKGLKNHQEIFKEDNMIKDKLQNGSVVTVNIPRGETRFTTYGVDLKTAMANFQKEMPEGFLARDYVRENNGKLECKVDWGNGPEWVSGDVITQVRGQNNPLYMFTPVAKEVIESPDWAKASVTNTGEMYKPAQFGVKTVEFTGENTDTILNEFGKNNADKRYGTYVDSRNGELYVCSIEKSEGQPLKVGQVLLEGGDKHELYTNREKDFLKKNPEELNVEQTEKDKTDLERHDDPVE